MKDIYHTAIEVTYAEAGAAAIEVRGLRVTSNAMEQAEQIVYQYSPHSVAGMVAADLCGDSAARSRVRHARLMDAYDAQTLNTVQRGQ
jgi:hypothetical protein